MLSNLLKSAVKQSNKMKKTFNQKCYELLKKVPKGKVTTYKSIANKLNTNAYRAVGNAMKYNKHPNKIPCFKVIKNDGTIGGYRGSFTKYTKEKIKKLQADGIIVRNSIVDMSKYLYKFNN